MTKTGQRSCPGAEHCLQCIFICRPHPGLQASLRGHCGHHHPPQDYRRGLSSRGGMTSSKGHKRSEWTPVTHPCSNLKMGRRVISLCLPEPRSRKYWMSGWMCLGMLLSADSIEMAERKGERERQTEIETETDSLRQKQRQVDRERDEYLCFHIYTDCERGPHTQSYKGPLLAFEEEVSGSWCYFHHRGQG